MPDARNVVRGRALRELVAMSLRGAGFENARHRTPPGRLSERIAMPDDERSDITGIENWFLGVHADLQPKWGTRLDAAEQGAALAGIQNSAVVEFRREADLDSFFVLMTFAQFKRLLHETRQEVSA